MKEQIITLIGILASSLLMACNPSVESESKGQITAQQTAEQLKAGNLNIGDPLPDFELSTIDGTTYRLQDMIDGDHYVAVIWHSPACPCATNCLTAVREELSGPEWADLKILGVASDAMMDVQWFREDLKKQIADGDVTFPVVLDKDFEVMKTYGAKRTPTVWLADKEGKIRFWGAPESTLYPDSPDHRILIKEALLALREGKTPKDQTFPPIGCLIDT